MKSLWKILAILPAVLLSGCAAGAAGRAASRAFMAIPKTAPKTIRSVPRGVSRPSRALRRSRASDEILERESRWNNNHAQTPFDVIDLLPTSSPDDDRPWERKRRITSADLKIDIPNWQPAPLPPPVMQPQQVFPVRGANPIIGNQPRWTP